MQFAQKRNDINIGRLEPGVLWGRKTANNIDDSQVKYIEGLIIKVAFLVNMRKESALSHFPKLLEFGNRDFSLKTPEFGQYFDANYFQ
jgi:hypothetical protein